MFHEFTTLKRSWFLVFAMFWCRWNMINLWIRPLHTLVKESSRILEKMTPESCWQRWSSATTSSSPSPKVVTFDLSWKSYTLHLLDFQLYDSQAGTITPFSFTLCKNIECFLTWWCMLCHLRSILITLGVPQSLMQHFTLFLLSLLLPILVHWWQVD